MTRIASFAAQQLALAQSIAIQSSMQDLQIKVSSGKESQDYTGIAIDTRRLINFETMRENSQQFIANITTVNQRLTAMETATSQAFDIASDLRTLLTTAVSNTSAADLAIDLQVKGMLEEVVGLLNTDQDGRFLFAGSKTDTQPVDLDALLNPTTPLVDAAEFTGAATDSTTGITSLPGILSVQVESGNNDDAFQLTFDNVGKNFTLTNLNGGLSQVVNLGTPPTAGTTKDIAFSIGGEKVVVTLDDTFTGVTPITTNTLAFTLGAGAGLLDTMSVQSTSGNISNINNNTIETSGTAANATLTLSSTDGNFVASGVDLSTTGLQTVTLTNANTNATVVVRFNVNTALDDPAVADPGTDIDLRDFFENVAATDGTVSFANVQPGATGYDPKNPYYYKGDNNTLSLRASEQVTVNYGVNAIDSGFEKLIRAAFIALDSSTPGSINKTGLESALSIALEAVDEIPNIRSKIGTSLSTLDNVEKSHSDTTLLADETIGDIENADVAQTLTLLAQNQSQIEATYATLGRLNTLSLLDFLR